MNVSPLSYFTLLKTSKHTTQLSLPDKQPLDCQHTVVIQTLFAVSVHKFRKKQYQTPLLTGWLLFGRNSWILYVTLVTMNRRKVVVRRSWNGHRVESLICTAIFVINIKLGGGAIFKRDVMYVVVSIASVCVSKAVLWCLGYYVTFCNRNRTFAITPSLVHVIYPATLFASKKKYLTAVILFFVLNTLSNKPLPHLQDR